MSPQQWGGVRRNEEGEEKMDFPTPEKSVGNLKLNKEQKTTTKRTKRSAIYKRNKKENFTCDFIQKMKEKTYKYIFYTYLHSYILCNSFINGNRNRNEL